MGYAIAVLNSLTVSLSDVFIRKLKGENTFFLIWLRMAAALPVLAVFVTVFAEWQIPELKFWLLILLLSMPLEIFQFYIGYTALQKSPLSLIAPLHSLSAIFLIPVSFLVLREVPSAIGFLGVVTIVAGIFFLGWQGQGSILQAFKNVFSEPGARLILLASIIVTIPITVSKFTFRYAPPLLSGFYITLAVAAALTPMALWNRKRELEPAKRLPFLAGLGVLSGSSFALHYTGLSLLPVAYYISTKRLSILFNVFFGRAFFKESHFRERIIGAALTVAGVALLALG